MDSSGPIKRRRCLLSFAGNCAAIVACLVPSFAGMRVAGATTKGENYGDEHVVFQTSGTAGNPIVFQGYDGMPTIDGQDARNRNMGGGTGRGGCKIL